MLAALLVQFNKLYLITSAGIAVTAKTRGEAVPSIDAAKKIADTPEVSLDHLVGDGLHNGFDKKTLKRFQVPGT